MSAPCLCRCNRPSAGGLRAVRTIIGALPVDLPRRSSWSSISIRRPTASLPTLLATCTALRVADVPRRRSVRAAASTSGARTAIARRRRPRSARRLRAGALRPPPPSIVYSNRSLSAGCGRRRRGPHRQRRDGASGSPPSSAVMAARWCRIRATQIFRACARRHRDGARRFGAALVAIAAAVVRAVAAPWPAGLPDGRRSTARRQSRAARDGPDGVPPAARHVAHGASLRLPRVQDDLPFSVAFAPHVARAYRGFDTYVDYLRLHPHEPAALFNSILVNVTGFFRDPEAWEVLRADALPSLLPEALSAGRLRVWSAGCSTGEETYSAAIAIADALGPRAGEVDVKIYATDVDEKRWSPPGRRSSASIS